ncbi:hypothetical protein [Streptomyces niveus]
MTYGLLTSDVPLGPFEGVAVTLWAAQGKQAKLHAKPSCSSLRSARVTQREVRLDALAVGRLCPQCAAYGAWAPRGTGLAVFVKAVTGLGLLYELHSYGEADEDACSDEDIDRAVTLLSRTPSSGPGGTENEEDEEDEDAWEVVREAREIRERVFVEWRRAASSLYRAHEVLGLFPWLKPWAETPMRLKAERLKVLRGQASRLVTPDALILAAAVSAMADPVLPHGDPAFAPLGDPAEVARQLKSLWCRWRQQVADAWDHPDEQMYLADQVTDSVGARRKGRDEVLARARQLLAQWQAEAQRVSSSGEAEHVLTARLLRPDAAVQRAYDDDSPLDRLSPWELGVLALWGVEADWEQFTIVLEVPEPVAARLLSQDGSGLSCVARNTQAPAVPEPASEPEGPLGPGVFDDTPVSARRPVTARHLRALRLASREADQLYLVFSVTAGPEVISLTALEQRCTAGWEGIIIAGAGDLPGNLVDTRQAAASPGVTPQGAGVWLPEVHDPHDPDFGRQLSTAEGERLLVRFCEGRQAADNALRTLALARGVPDLRELDGGYDDEGHHRNPFPAEVWHGLLAMEQLVLEPFETSWSPGSGLPLGVLAQVQAYTTDAAGRYEGRAHSPECPHRRPQSGVGRDDDMATIEELLNNTDFDPCGKCGGYAVRRLTDTQVAYYRAAHRLHDLMHRPAARHDTTGTGPMREILDELDDQQTAQAWFPTGTQARQWRRLVHRLRRELPEPSAP